MARDYLFSQIPIEEYETIKKLVFKNINSSKYQSNRMRYGSPGSISEGGLTPIHERYGYGHLFFGAPCEINSYFASLNLTSLDIQEYSNDFNSSNDHYYKFFRCNSFSTLLDLFYAAVSKVVSVIDDLSYRSILENGTILFNREVLLGNRGFLEAWRRVYCLTLD